MSGGFNGGTTGDSGFGFGFGLGFGFGFGFDSDFGLGVGFCRFSNSSCKTRIAPVWSPSVY